MQYEDADRSIWEYAIKGFSEANFLQSWQWGEVHEEIGEKVIRRMLYIDGEPAGLLMAIVKNARRGRYLEVPGGPLIDWQNNQVVELTTTELQNIARLERCVFVRMRPQLVETPENSATLKRQGFIKAQMHLNAEHTNIIDLTPDLETLLTNMRQQTRYEVRRVEKRGIKVSWSSDIEAIEAFHQLQSSTASRQQFIPPSREYLLACQKRLGDNLKVYRAEKEGRLLNLAIVITYGREADYFEAASTDEARKEPGAYGIIWRAMRDAKDAGIERLNLWGIAGSDDPNHRYAGVTTFKRGFGGQDVSYVAAHDLVIDKLRYAANWLVETARKKRRRL